MFERKIKDMISTVASDNEQELIQEFCFNNDKKNELLFFFKPECFIDVDIESSKKIIEIAFGSFDRFDMNISGILVLSGKVLEELGIMGRHYGYIDTISKGASKILGQDDYELMAKHLENAHINASMIYGGHEFLGVFTDYDEESLDQLWLTKERVKLRSGFYFHEYNVDNRRIILINGFHPRQLLHYNHPSHRIIVILLQSDTHWSVLRDDMVGNTYPEKAKPRSIRSELYQSEDVFALQEVCVSRNYVHLSAGPFEAFFEIYNFLKDIDAIDFKFSSTNLYRLMAEEGFNEQEIEKTLENPPININGKSTDLFSVTEHKDTLEAIGLYSEIFEGRRSCKTPGIWCSG